MTRAPPPTSPRRGRGPAAAAALAAAIVLGAGALLLFADGAPSDDLPGRSAEPAALQAAASPGGSASRRAAVTSARPEDRDPEGHLAAGEDLLGRNAPGAPGASREGLLKAQDELEAALRLGCSRPAAARRLLAAVFTALGQEWAESLGEGQAYEERARDALREVVAASPQDVDARLAYAKTMREPAARVPELREAARLAPGDGEIRRLLGLDLLGSGEVKEGARQLVEASRLLGRDGMEEHGLELLSHLRANGCEEEEARVRERIEQLGL